MALPVFLSMLQGNGETCTSGVQLRFRITAFFARRIVGCALKIGFVQNRLKSNTKKAANFLAAFLLNVAER